MSLSETKVIDEITVRENGIVLYREATRIFRSGELVAETLHRTSLTPGQDLTDQPAQVVAIAEVSWTPEVVAAYEATQNAARIAEATRAADVEARIAAARAISVAPGAN